MSVRDRIAGFVRALPAAHRVAIVAAVAALVMLAVPFVRWITTPSYAVLYGGLDDTTLAEVVDGLQAQGVPYRLEAGGSQVLVPAERLYETRAGLAADGVAASRGPAGWELLDEQGLSVSDFRQRVDYRRALEGELSRTLAAMEGIRSATVHLVVPERELFAERQEPVTASVLVDTTRPLSEREIEAVTFLVASSVEGLEVDRITVADASGTVLHAPGDANGAGAATNRNQRQTREFEQAVAGDIESLLERVTGGGPVSVVVRARLNFDESQTYTETYEPDSQVALREQTNEERFEGTGAAPGGAVGIDGGPLQAEAGESTYDKDEALREFGVDKITASTTAAPGRVERLSVAIVMDDGSASGADVPAVDELERLVTAAVGLDAERGDEIAVTTMPLEAATVETPPAAGGLLDHLPQAIGVVVLLAVCVALLWMARRRGSVQVTMVERRSTSPVAALGADEPEALEAPAAEPVGARAGLQRDVADLVERQPEEIAVLLRGWLADRRGQQP